MRQIGRVGFESVLALSGPTLRYLHSGMLHASPLSLPLSSSKKICYTTFLKRPPPVHNGVVLPSSRCPRACLRSLRPSQGTLGIRLRGRDSTPYAHHSFQPPESLIRPIRLTGCWWYHLSLPSLHARRVENIQRRSHTLHPGIKGSFCRME